MVMIFLIFAASLGAIGVGISAALLKKRRVAEQWPAVPGEIVDVKLNENNSSHDGTTYSLEVHYQYEIDGLTREGKSGWWRVYPSKATAVRELNQYPRGTIVTVRVNPSDATNSEIILDGNSTDRVFNLFLICTSFTVACLVAIPFMRPPGAAELLIAGLFVVVAGLMLLVVLAPIFFLKNSKGSER